MKIFKLSGKMYFKARNINDAFIQISKHFKSLSNSGEGIELLSGTNVKIKAKHSLYQDISPMTPLSVGVETSYEKKK